MYLGRIEHTKSLCYLVQHLIMYLGRTEHIQKKNKGAKTEPEQELTLITGEKKPIEH